MRSPILYFLLLVLGIPLTLGLYASQKWGRFSKTLSKKSFEFIASRGGAIALNQSFVLLPVEIDSVIGKQSQKENLFRFCGTGRVKMIFALPTEIVAFHT